MSKQEPTEGQSVEIDDEVMQAFVADLMAQAQAQARLARVNPDWSDPAEGRPSDLDGITESLEIVADRCASLETFFIKEEPEKDRPEYLVLGFQAGQQELVILFTEDTWLKFNGVIARSVESRNKDADKPWGEV